MNITLNNIGKQYRNEWIFRSANKTFSGGNAYAILGANGSGKSTFIKLLSGFLTATEGTIVYEQDSKNIPLEEIHQHVSIAAPYLDLYDDYTLEEAIAFQAKFKPFKNNYSVADIKERCEVNTNTEKLLKDFSSGMKQRVKLALAILADTPLLLLDEPTMNLDMKGVEWYRQLIAQHIQNRLVFVASNSQGEEYDFCGEQILIETFKK